MVESSTTQRSDKEVTGTRVEISVEKSEATGYCFSLVSLDLLLVFCMCMHTHVLRNVCLTMLGLDRLRWRIKRDLWAWLKAMGCKLTFYFKIVLFKICEAKCGKSCPFSVRIRTQIISHFLPQTDHWLCVVYSLRRTQSEKWDSFVAPTQVDCDNLRSQQPTLSLTPWQHAFKVELCFPPAHGPTSL